MKPHCAYARFLQSRTQSDVQLASHHHLQYVQCFRVGDATPGDNLGRYAEPLAKRRDLRPAAVNHDK